MADTMDRPIDEITRSVMAVILSGRIKGQFARDLEKLCAVALSAAPPAAAPTREQVRAIQDAWAAISEVEEWDGSWGMDRLETALRNAGLLTKE